MQFVLTFRLPVRSTIKTEDCVSQPSFNLRPNTKSMSKTEPRSIHYQLDGIRCAERRSGAATGRSLGYLVGIHYLPLPDCTVLNFGRLTS